MKEFHNPLGATALTPEEMEGLKRKHITTRGELDRWEQENIQEAMAWLARRRKSEILDEAFICRLHEEMFGKVWKWAGEFRRTNKNIGVDWKEIPVAMRQLLDDAKYWVANSVYGPDEIAYRFHHKIVWIHVFPNGNGRHARMVADILLTDVLNSEVFTWGSGNLSSTSELRGKYIAALRAADEHDFTQLHEFVRS